MDFEVDFGKFSDQGLLDTVRELYMILGYYDVCREFPKPHSVVSSLCHKYNPKETNKCCEPCPMEKIIFVGKDICFYMGHANKKKLVPSIKHLTQRFENIIELRKLDKF